MNFSCFLSRFPFESIDGSRDKIDGFILVEYFWSASMPRWFVTNARTHLRNKSRNRRRRYGCLPLRLHYVKTAFVTWAM